MDGEGTLGVYLLPFTRNQMSWRLPYYHIQPVLYQSCARCIEHKPSPSKDGIKRSKSKGTNDESCQHRGRKEGLSLVKDPQSLPLRIPVQPENYIKREVRVGLTTFIVNKAVLALFADEAAASQETLVQDLSKIRPCNPKLLNKLYALSNVGLQERWMGMFTNTRSIQQLAFRSWSDELEVIDAIKSMEMQFSRYLRTKRPSDYVTEIEEASCITTYTQLLREKMWGVTMEGITMPPQQEQTKMYPWEDIGKEHFVRHLQNQTNQFDLSRCLD